MTFRVATLSICLGLLSGCQSREADPQITVSKQTSSSQFTKHGSKSTETWGAHSASNDEQLTSDRLAKNAAENSEVEDSPAIINAVAQLKEVAHAGDPEQLSIALKRLDGFLNRSLGQPNAPADAMAKALIRSFDIDSSRSQDSVGEIVAIAKSYLIQRQIQTTGITSETTSHLSQFASSFPDSHQPIDLCLKIADGYLDQQQHTDAIQFLTWANRRLADHQHVGKIIGRLDFIKRSMLVAGSAPIKRKPNPLLKNLGASETSKNSRYANLLGQTMDLSGRTATGRTFSSRGKWTAAVFWASWCGPCRKKVPQLSEIQADLSQRGIELVGVNLDDDRAARDDFLDDNSIGWPQIEEGNQLADRYGIESIPTILLIDPRGKIREAGLRSPHELILLGDRHTRPSR